MEDTALHLLELLGHSVAHAQEAMEGFTPISNGFKGIVDFTVSDSLDGVSDFGTFVNGIYKLCIRLGAAVAVAMFVWGGITYVVAPLGMAGEGISEAKARMQNAIIGLLMLLSTWVIFYQINPDILNLKIQSKPLQALPSNITNEQPPKNFVDTLTDTGVAAPSSQNFDGIESKGNILKDQSTGQCYSTQESCTFDGVCTEQVVTTACSN